MIGVQSPDGNFFDSIVYGEKDPGQWLPGSNGFERTKQLAGPAEQRAKHHPVHLAIAYDADGSGLKHTPKKIAQFNVLSGTGSLTKTGAGALTHVPVPASRNVPTPGMNSQA